MAAADIQTADLYISPDLRGAAQTPNGYTVSESVTATLRQVSAAGGQIDAAILAGGNAVNALTSLCEPCRVPLLLVVTHRGEPGGAPDEPQHELMGRITPALLDTMGIGWEKFRSIAPLRA